MKRSGLLCSVFLTSASLAGVATAKDVTVDIHKVSADGVGDKIGEAVLSESADGVGIKFNVKGVAAGEHGFHVHEKGDCGPAMKDGKMGAAVAAGAHFDPESKKTHKGPQGDGHKGDAPKLTATAQGISETVTVPKLKLADVLGRSLMIHEGGDNYSDNPENGGGGARIACGVIPKS